MQQQLERRGQLEANVHTRKTLADVLSTGKPSGCGQCVSHMEGLGNAVMVSRLLGGQAFVGRVAGVGKPRPLLELVHAILSLL